MPEGNYIGRGRKNYSLSGDCRYFIACLASYMGTSESGVVEEAVRQLHLKKLGRYEWDKPIDPRPRHKSFKPSKPGEYS